MTRVQPRRSVMDHAYHDRSKIQPWEKKALAKKRWLDSVAAYTHETLDYPSACALAAVDLLGHSKDLRAGVLDRLTIPGRKQ